MRKVCVLTKYSIITTLILTVFIHGCGTPKLSKPISAEQRKQNEYLRIQQENQKRLERYLAHQRQQQQKRNLYLQKQQENQTSTPNKQLNGLQTNSEQAFIDSLLLAQKRAKNGDYRLAYRLIQQQKEKTHTNLPVNYQIAWAELRANTALRYGDVAMYLESEYQTTLLYDTNQKRLHSSTILHNLLHFQTHAREIAITQLSNNTFSLGWLDLTNQLTNLPAGYAQQQLALRRWSRTYQGHFALRYPPKQIRTFFQDRSNATSAAVLLPTSGSFANFGNAIATGFNAIATNPANNIRRFRTYDSASTQSLAQAQNTIYGQPIDLVIGPLQKNHTQIVWNDAQLPNVLTLNYVYETHIPSLPNQDATNDGTRTIQRTQQGLSIEEGGVWMAQLVNALQDFRVAIVVEKERNSLKALSSFRKIIAQQPATYYFDTGQSLTEAIEQALGVNAFAIKKFKSELADMRSLLDKSNDINATQWQTLYQSHPIDTLREKISTDLVLFFGSGQAANQVMPLMDFYYAQHIPLIALSSAYDLSITKEQLHTQLDGIYFLDAPAIIRNPSHWHEWITRDFVIERPFYRFYALGVDAALVAGNLSRLQKTPGFRIRGSSGKLGYNADTHTITRELTLFHITNGQLRMSSAGTLLQALCTPAPSETKILQSKIREHFERNNQVPPFVIQQQNEDEENLKHTRFGLCLRTSGA